MNNSDLFFIPFLQKEMERMLTELEVDFNATRERLQKALEVSEERFRSVSPPNHKSGDVLLASQVISIFALTCVDRFHELKNDKTHHHSYLNATCQAVNVVHLSEVVSDELETRTGLEKELRAEIELLKMKQLLSTSAGPSSPGSPSSPGKIRTNDRAIIFEHDFEKPGSLGLRLREEGVQECLVRIKEVKEAALEGLLHPGLRICQVGPHEVSGLRLEETMDLISKAGRPMTMKLALDDQTAVTDDGSFQIQVVLDTMRSEIRSLRRELRSKEDATAGAKKMGKYQSDNENIALQTKVSELENKCEAMKERNAQIEKQRQKLQVECTRHMANSADCRLEIKELQTKLASMESQVLKAGEGAEVRTEMWSQLLSQRDALQSEVDRLKALFESTRLGHFAAVEDLETTQGKLMKECHTKDTKITALLSVEHTLHLQLKGMEKKQAELATRAIEVATVTESELARRSQTEKQLEDMLTQVQQQLKSISGVLSRTSEALTDRSREKELLEVELEVQRSAYSQEIGAVKNALVNEQQNQEILMTQFVTEQEHRARAEVRLASVQDLIEKLNVHSMKSAGEAEAELRRRYQETQELENERGQLRLNVAELKGELAQGEELGEELKKLKETYGQEKEKHSLEVQELEALQEHALNEIDAKDKMIRALNVEVEATSKETAETLLNLNASLTHEQDARKDYEVRLKGAEGQLCVVRAHVSHLGGKVNVSSSPLYVSSSPLYVSFSPLRFLQPTICFLQPTTFPLAHYMFLPAHYMFPPAHYFS